MISHTASRYRWAVLALGAASTAAMAAVQGGLPALGPALQAAFGLSLVEVTAVFTSFGLGAALLANAPSALFVPMLMAGGMFAMSWNGLSFTAAAEISGGAQAGRAMGLQNTQMRIAGAAVPLALGALAGGALLGPLVVDEDRRRDERRLRLARQAA